MNQQHTPPQQQPAPRRCSARPRWHETPIEALAAQLATDVQHGLSPQDASERLAKIGPNELRKEDALSPWAILLSQFRSLVIWVLIGAALVSVFLGELTDGIAITAIVALNGVIGFFQEYRAERAAAALARLTAPRAKVVRGGHATVIAASEVVPGDVLLLDAGDLVAADARVLDAAALRANEAPLTGESQPVEKRTGTCAPDTPLADRTNMIFLGTSIVGGAGRALVVATGMETEVGRIAELLRTAASDETPLQKRIDFVARRLLWACLGIVLVVFALGLLRGIDLFELFLGAVSLAVAAIPEGLPAVVTVALALGMQRMARRHALVRRLPAVETLGCAQVICSDKTGTLTVGEMTARKVVTSEHVVTVGGEGYTPDGGFFTNGAEYVAPEEGAFMAVLRAAAACNDAELVPRDGVWTIVGDPTEGALLTLAAKGGVHRGPMEMQTPRCQVIPFDAHRKRMTVLRRRKDHVWACMKGAPEIVLDRCTHLRTDDGCVQLTESDRARLLQAGAILARDALRVLALAERRLDTALFAPGATLSEEDIEQELTFLGLVGLQDPPRAEARDAIVRCQRAGIRTVMITGDHPDTARAIARELGMLNRDDEVVTGAELERLTDQALADRVHRISVYARVTAEHKLRIVRAWKAQGAVVAMTGDGVNDAPALKEASIGVAMGRTGTEVTKEAADLIITDDNFASIVAAVEEGRGIYDNIAKTLGYLLAGNVGELLVMLLAGVVGWPLPLLPIQLLWINLVTDGLPALALATDPIDPDVLRRPPRRPDAQLMDRAFLRRTLLIGVLTAGVALTAFTYEWVIDGSLADARNAAFSALVIAELLRSFGARSETQTIWQIGLFSNLRLFLIVVVSFVLQLLIHHGPVFETLFGTKPISLAQCAAWMVLGALPLLVLEMTKVARQLYRQRR
ncbi:MAG TPA: cation-translocating P-type ATPase [Methylomirabilota bacterium]|nr:cation-translocating P-type ATPase [Methylomirabilota bacterium]